jgi:GxxExxY protein
MEYGFKIRVIQKSNKQSSDSGKWTMINEKYKYSELTSKIIGCAMRVHSALGNGFQEVIYQRALAIEMTDSGLSFHREMEMPVFYKEHRIGTRRVDFLVEDIISVEIKALIKLEDVHLAQAINYLEAYNLEIGLLINFGAPSLEFKRVANKKYKSEL